MVSSRPGQTTLASPARCAARGTPSAAVAATAHAALRRWCAPGSATGQGTSAPAWTTRAPTARAASSSTGTASGSPPVPMTATRPGFQIPAFSRAMAPRSWPSTSSWSSATPVTTATSASTTLVASSRPPRPTSSTVASTPSSAKLRIPMTVSCSKKVSAPGAARW